jgi:hypothetical protein
VNYDNGSPYQAVMGNNLQGSNLGQIHATYDVGFGAPGIGPGAPHNTQLALKIFGNTKALFASGRSPRLFR